MNANRIAKESQVKEIVDKINNSKSLVIAEYAGLTVVQTQELRRKLKAQGVELKVYKNRLFKIAAKEAGFDGLATDLVGPNAFAFGMEDEISPTKVLAKFAKEHESLKLKMGTYEGKVIGQEELHVIATLPSYDEALTMLAMSMLSPIKFVGSGLHMLATEGHLEAGAQDAPVAKEEVKVDQVKKEIQVEDSKQTPETSEEAKVDEAPEVPGTKEKTNETTEKVEEAKGE
ncbi:50S ribosomal protein L10 [Candidatus Mycoplasma mahonii]|uniref:50S ribosomal protein L10 n=1 Tax=Candidatus Mycoplasma mahonii TaxID=3004105 RepID=UPI0027E5678D|nr:50S ribosomal protein L10 [Candidatus Mycoplasma mahonii]